MAMACGAEAGQEAVSWAGTVDTVNGVVTVNNPGTPILDGESAWRVEEDLSIGSVFGDPEYQFTDIAHIEVDEDGAIYVLDRGERQVAVYDSAGPVPSHHDRPHRTNPRAPSEGEGLGAGGGGAEVPTGALSRHPEAFRGWAQLTEDESSPIVK